MQFLYPYFLFALTLVAIPVIIHLFNFRRYKTVYFSHVDFLKNIKKESKKKSRLKQLLILIARILAVASMVFAFSQPYIPLNNRVQNNPEQIVAVYVDNSFSMNSKAEQGQLLEIARNKAVEIAKEYRPGTKFRLFTNDLQLKHRHFFNKEQFIQQVSEIIVSPKVISLSRIFNQLNETISDAESKLDKTIYFISDFQRSITDIQNFEQDTSVWSYLIPLVPGSNNNLFIDSCWFESPSRKLGEEEHLFVKVVNNSNEDFQNLPLKFLLNDSLKSLANFNIKANGEIIISLKFTNIKSGFHYGRVELTDYPVTYDNTYYLSYNVLPGIKSLAIYNNNEKCGGISYLKALFENDQYATLDVMSGNNVKISEYNTIFLVDLKEVPSGTINEIDKAAKNGASIVFFPEIDGDIENYNRFLAAFNANQISGVDSLTQRIGGINMNTPVYENVFKKDEGNVSLPEINGHFKYKPSIQSMESKLMWFKNNDKALSSVSHGDGFLHSFSFPLSEENEDFAMDVVFVPTIYGLVLNSLPKQKIAYEIGEDHYVYLTKMSFSNKNYPVHLLNKKSNEEFIPETQVSNTNQIRLELSGIINDAGQYVVTSDGLQIAPLSFNYDRSESVLTYYSKDELEKELSISDISNSTIIGDYTVQFSKIFDELQNGKQLWKWFIFAALVFILAESLIIRFWKE